METEDKPQVQKDQDLKVEENLEDPEKQTEETVEEQLVQKIMPQRRISSKALWTVMTVTLMILMFLHLALNLNVHDLKRPCPQNAACSLFLTCDGGYEFIKEKYECMISKEAGNQAFEILSQITQQLSYEFGDLNCHTLYSKEQSQKGHGLVKPTRSILLILQGIKQPGVKKLFIEYVQQEFYQEGLGYWINRRDQIVPEKMKISNMCLMKKTYENHKLQFVFILIFSFVMLLMTCFGIYNCKFYKGKEYSIRIGQFILEMIIRTITFFANTLKNHCKNFFNQMKNKASQKWTALGQEMKNMQESLFVL